MDKDDGTEVFDSVNDITVTNYEDNSLVNGTTYFYTAFAYDKAQPAAKFAVGASISVTPQDIIAPSAVTGFTSDNGSNFVIMNWLNPSDADFKAVLLLRKEGGYAGSPIDPLATVVYEGSAQTFSDKDIVADTTYYYSIYAYDTAIIPNYTGAAELSVTTTSDNTSPTVSMTTPREAAINVAPNAEVSAQFSESILPESVTPTAFTLYKLSSDVDPGTKIDGTVDFVAGTTDTLNFKTKSPLPLLTPITAHLNSELTDLSSNPLDPTPQTQASEYKWSFTTVDGIWAFGGGVSLGDKVDSVDNTNFKMMDVAMDAAGDGIAVWSESSTTGPDLVRYSRYSMASGWDAAPSTISSSSNRIAYTQVGMDATGNTLVAWVEGAGTTQWYLYAARYTVANESWDSPILLQTDTSQNVNAKPAVAVNDSGDVVIVWEQDYTEAGTATAKSDMWAKYFKITDNWQTLPAAERIEWDDFDFSNQPSVGIDGQGNAIAVFVSYSPVAGAARINYNYYNVTAGAWDQPGDSINPVHPHAALDADILDRVGSDQPRIAMSENGDAMVTWFTGVTVPSPSIFIYAKAFSNGAWNALPPAIISSPIGALNSPGNIINTSVAIDPKGNAMVLTASKRDNTTIIYPRINRYEPGQVSQVSNGWLGEQYLRQNAKYDVSQSGIQMDDSGNAIIVLSATRYAYYFRYIKDQNWQDFTTYPLKLITTESAGLNHYTVISPELAVSTPGNSIAVWNRAIDVDNPDCRLPGSIDNGKPICKHWYYPRGQEFKFVPPTIP